MKISFTGELKARISLIENLNLKICYEDCKLKHREDSVFDIKISNIMSSIHDSDSCYPNLECSYIEFLVLSIP